MTPIIFAALYAPHTCIEAMHSSGFFVTFKAIGRTVVRSKDYDGIVGNAQRFQLFQQFVKIIVNIGNHTIKSLLGLKDARFVLVLVVIFLGYIIRTVGGIQA